MDQTRGRGIGAGIGAGIGVGAAIAFGAAAFAGGGRFAGCGQFQPGPQSCIQFVATTGESFFVNDTEGQPFFQPRFVTGTIVTTACLPPIPQAPGLVDLVVGDCDLRPFAGCGTLGLGPQGCILFVDALSGIGYTLDDLGGFGPGDQLFVEGVVVPDTFDCFPVIVDRIAVDSIGDCIDVPFEQCGTLQPIQFCGLALVAADGWIYTIDDPGRFEAGDSVAVAGVLDPFCIMIPECPAAGCVEVASITACGETYFSGCGALQIGPQGCITFQGDDVDGFFTLAEYGSFLPGARVEVAGPVTPDVLDCFPFIVSRIENVSIEVCCPQADLNDDCVVDGSDLGILIASWGPCGPLVPCAGDLSGDGAIDGTDLGLLLSQWTPPGG